MFVNVSGLTSDLPPQSSVPSTPPQQSSVPAASASKRRQPQKIHVCPHCGFERVRKSNMDDHLATFHGEGTPRTCNICGKNLKTKEGLKEHKKKVHEKVYKHKCHEPECTFGIQSM